jgi:signal peptidase I
LKLPRRSTSLYVLGFILFLVVFAFLELTYTRRVDGTSMLPTLEEGDLVVIQNVPFSNLQVGDIIVYNPPCSATGSSVIHRIIEPSGGGFITKGDNNPYTDPSGGISRGAITADCYVGKVVFVVPYIERIASLPYGTNYIIAALILIAIIYLWLGEPGHNKDTESEKATPPEGSTDTGQAPDSRSYLMYY